MGIEHATQPGGNPTPQPPGPRDTRAERFRRGRANLLLLAGSLLSAALIGEVALRVSGWGQPTVHVLKEGVVLKKRPHATYWNRKENLNRVELNRFGFHDVEPKLDPCTVRIVVMGDSFVEGEQVPIEDLFTSQIRQIWTGPEIEILNAGLSGTGTAAQYNLWRVFVDRELSPDIVILGFFMGNDLENNHPGLGSAPDALAAYLDAEGRVQVNETTESRRKKWIAGLRRYSALMNTVYERLYLLKRQILNARLQKDRAEKAHREEIPRHQELRDDPAWNETIEGTLSLLRTWHHQLAARKIPFGIVVISAESFFSTGSMEHAMKDRFLRQLLHLGEEIQMPVLGLRLDDEPREATYFPYRSSFGHFNQRGHRLAAEEIAPWLDSSFPIQGLADAKRAGCS